MNNSIDTYWQTTGENTGLMTTSSSQNNLSSASSDQNLADHTRLCYLAASPLMKCITDAAVLCFDKGTVPQSLIGSLNAAEQIDIAVKGEAIFKQMADAIRLAENEVLLQTFTWDVKIPGLQWINAALQDVAQRKKTQASIKPLKVYILIDERGTLANVCFNGKIPQKWPCTPENLHLFSAPGLIDVYAATFHHNSFRGNHAKTLIVDSKILVITGANFQASNFGHLPAHDASIQINGPIALAARADFVETWNSPARHEEIPSPPLQNESLANIQHNYSQGNVPILFVSTKARQELLNTSYDNPLAVAFLSALSQAKNKIQIATPNLNAPPIIEALVNFINNTNGTLELILGKGFNDSREAMPSLGGTNQNTVNTLFSKIHEDKLGNLKVRWFSLDGKTPVVANVAGACHLKFMAIDEQITLFGNANLDIVSLTSLHETNIIIDDKIKTKAFIDAVFLPVFQSSVEATPSETSKEKLLDYTGFRGMQDKLAPANTLVISQVDEEGGGFKTLHFQKPTSWQFQPGQYLQIRSGNRFSSLFKSPATLAIASGTHDGDIQVTARSSLLPWHSNHSLQRNEGQALEIIGPIGIGFPMDLIKPATELILIGGGSGITVLKCLMHSLPAHTQVSLYYSAKTQGDLIYHDLLKQWRHAGHSIALTQETADGFQHGRITEALSTCPLNSQTLVFLCGPTALVKAAIEKLTARGLERRQIFASLPVGAKDGGPVFRGDHPKLL